MMLTLHTQVENLANLLRVRRSASAQRTTVEQAYVSLAAAILDVPATRLVQTVPATAVAQPVPLTRRAAPRRAA
jgi:hypothetical protein